MADFGVGESRHSAPKTEAKGTKGQNLLEFLPSPLKTVMPVLGKITYLLDNFGEFLKLDGSTSRTEFEEFIDTENSESPRILLAFVEFEFPSGLSVKKVENIFVLFDLLKNSIFGNSLIKEISFEAKKSSKFSKISIRDLSMNPHLILHQMEVGSQTIEIENLFKELKKSRHTLPHTLVSQG